MIFYAISSLRVRPLYELKQEYGSNWFKTQDSKWFKNKNKNNFILHRIFKITNTSCQLFIDLTNKGYIKSAPYT